MIPREKLIRDMPTNPRLISLFQHLFRMKRWHVITDLINYYKFENYTEIGVGQAQTTLYVLNHCKSLKKIYAIDNYPPYEQYSSRYQNRTFEEVRTKLAIPKVTFWNHSSEEASKRIPDSYLDIVFLDANHQYESIKQDIELWYPKLKPNGILIGHDYGLRTMGVINAVTEKFRYINICDDKTWWVQSTPEVLR